MPIKMARLLLKSAKQRAKSAVAIVKVVAVGAVAGPVKAK
jgi:hypothetical protein